MKTDFEFTPRQRVTVAKLAGAATAVPDIEDLVRRFRVQSSKHMTVRDVRDRVQEVRKASKKLSAALRALERAGGHSADWILEPLDQCEHYASGLYEYQFKRGLPAGRPPESAKTDLVRALASYWKYVLQRDVGTGRGPFSRFVQKLLDYSGVPGASIENPEEVVRQALTTSIGAYMCEAGYPFAHRHERDKLTPTQRHAEEFFSTFLLTPGAPAWRQRPSTTKKRQISKK
ncbi:MAG: hypothetical protein IPK20_00100 [Betaproteobacteria bacterium]|nr:hypothetical protein [Betaproteobacteria bacterium]